MIIGGLALGFFILFSWLDYTSPVHEAGREYRKLVSIYKGDDIETVDDVYERLGVLHNHFNSTTFDKVQGGEKTDVKLSHLETLFGEPHQTIEDVRIPSTDTVYRYHYGNLTLNFHEHFRDVEEYLAESYTETLYNPSALDRLFIDTIIDHQSQYDKKDGQFEAILEEDFSQLRDETPTRKVRQGGWYTRSLNPYYFYDDGRGEYAPDEHLLFQFEEDYDENYDEISILFSMERRYSDVFLKQETQETIEQRKEALSQFKHFFEEKEVNKLDEKHTLADFLNAFGDIALLNCNFEEGLIRVIWLIQEDKYPQEIIAYVPVTNIDNITDIEDLNELEVVELDAQISYSGNKTYDNNWFISSN